MIQSLLLLVILFVLTLFIFYTFKAYFVGGPYVPTAKRVIDLIFDTVKLPQGSVFYDLGSGDGRVCIAAAKKGFKAVGYEFNPFWCLLSKMIIAALGLSSKIKIRYGNIVQADLKEADCIYFYLFPQKVAELAEQLKLKTKKGVTIVTHKFPLPQWPTFKYVQSEKLYFYINNEK